MHKLYILFSLFLGFQSYGQISGTVYRDINNDGIQQVTEPTVLGATVNAYDDNNTVIATTLTAANGTYSLPYTVPVRIEFEMPVSLQCFMETKDFCGLAPNGDNVRFISGNATNIDFAVQNVMAYQSGNPINVYVNRFNKGNPLLTGSAADTTRAVLGYPITTSGNITSTAIPYSLKSGPVGATWGMAFSKHAQRVFCAAFIKRYSGLGPLGTGGIYMLTPNGNTFLVSNFYDLDANGHRTRAANTAVPFGLNSSFSLNAGATQIDYLGPVDPISGSPEGLGVVGANDATGRKLVGTINYSIDSSVFDQVCKVGLGDLDISEDGRYLFVTNLYSRTIYRLELDNVKNPTGILSVDSYPLPAIAVSNGVLRPFGLCFHKGKLYIGAVATAENGGVNILNGATDMYAYVFTMDDPSGPSPSINATPFFTMPLNYHKGTAVGSFGSGTDEWHPWTNRTDLLFGGGERARPTPVLTDIGFSDRNDLILDFMDRAGHQFGYSGSFAKLAGTQTVALDCGGDIITAGVDCNTAAYTLENNGSYSSSGTVYTSAGVGNNQGLGGGEFYVGDTGNAAESEGSQGSLAMIPGQNGFMFTMMDVQGLINAGSCILSCNNGAKTLPFVLANSTQFGKANSMGDIEISGDVPPIQIGNRVWNDGNSNGIQDPTEAGIANVTLELFADFDQNDIPDGPALGSATTDVNGRYYFDESNVADGDPSTAGNQAGPIGFKRYLIRIAPADWSSGSGINELLTFSLTLKDVPGTGQFDARDNDAELMASIPTVRASTEFNAKNIHDFDFGFNQCSLLPMNDITLNCDNPTAIIGQDSVIGVVYSWSPTAGLSNPSSSKITVSPTTTTTYTLTADVFCSEEITVFVDNIPPVADAGPARNLNCDSVETIIGTPAQSGNTYTWSPNYQVSNINEAQPLVKPDVTTTYTVTVKGSNGCINASTVTVFVDRCCTQVVMPNSFTPNDDKLNDTYGVIEISDLRNFSLYIYNRFGEQVFYSKQKEVRWDGKYKGQVCDVGSYYYMLIYDCGGEDKMLKGDISLIR